MARVLIPLTLLLVAFWIYSIVDCALQPPTRHRGVGKPAWILIVLLLPVFGGVLWFAVGRPQRGRPVAAPRPPDDDPQFLGSIGSIADQDERIRRLEEELAALDAEADDPRSHVPDAMSGAEADESGTRGGAAAAEAGDDDTHVTDSEGVDATRDPHVTGSGAIGATDSADGPDSPDGYSPDSPDGHGGQGADGHGADNPESAGGHGADGYSPESPDGAGAESLDGHGAADADARESAEDDGESRDARN